jgi:hypothetical protein
MYWLKTKEEKTKLLGLYLQIYHSEIVCLHTEIASTDEGKANRINSKIMTAGLIKSLINLDEVELLGIGRICNNYLLGDKPEEVVRKISISRVHAIIIKNRNDHQEMFILDVSGLNGFRLKNNKNNKVVVKSDLNSGLAFHPLKDIQEIIIEDTVIQLSRLNLFKEVEIKLKKETRAALLKESIFKSNLTASGKTKTYSPGMKASHVIQLLGELDVELKRKQKTPNGETSSIYLNISNAIRDAARFAAESINESSRKGFKVNNATNKLLRKQIPRTTSNAMDYLYSTGFGSEHDLRIKLNYSYDFATDRHKDAVVIYQIPNKEKIILDQRVGERIYDKQKQDLLGMFNFEDEKLDMGNFLFTLTCFISEQFTHSSQPLAELTAENSSHFLHEYCEARTGVGRHMSFLAANLLGNIVRDNRAIFSENCSVRVYRSITNKLTQHSIVIVSHGGDFYIVDPAFKVLHKIRSSHIQEDFNQCCSFYDRNGMSWLMQNFALTQNLTIPQELMDKPMDPTTLANVDEILSQSDALEGIFDEFICPISGAIMTDPVYVLSGNSQLTFDRRDSEHPDGYERHVFDRNSIETWQRQGGNSAHLNPLNRLAIFLIQPANTVKRKLIQTIITNTNILMPEETVLAEPNSVGQNLQLSMMINNLLRAIEDGVAPSLMPM